MSPEQAQARPADARADLYSIGVILYEATTGRKPFTGASVYEILRGHIELAPVPPRQVAPDLPPAYEQVILRALAKDPAHRWQSAYELMTALDAACQFLPPPAWDALTSRPRNESVGPPTPSTTPHGPPRKESRRAAIVVIATLLVSGVVAAGIALAVQGGDSSESAGPGEAVAVAPRPASEGPADAGGDTLTQVPPSDPSGARGAEPAEANRADEIGAKEASAAADQHGPKRPRTRGGAAPLPSSGLNAAAPAQPTSSDPPAPASTAKPTPAKGRRSLDERINESNPTPTAWDVTGYLPKALATAKSYFPDAVLIRIDADGVYPSGRANLTLDPKFDVLYRFMSPSAAVRPKDLPLGVEHKPTCILYVLVNGSEVTAYTLKGWSCAKEVKIRMPRCSAKEVWAKAAAQGAPTDNAVAELSYRIFRGRPTWLLQIGKEHDHEIPDDC